MNPRSNSGPRVALVCSDPLLSERNRLAVSRDTDWQLSVFHDSSEYRTAAIRVALLVVPVADVLSSVPRTDPPTIGYGAADALRTAFLKGCRDYLRTPWRPDELILRGEASLSRDVVTTTAGTISFTQNALGREDRSVPLRYCEYEILRLLARSEDGLVTRESLRAVFGYPAVDSRSIDMHMSHLRRKLEAVSPISQPITIRAVRGVGYRLVS